MQTMKAAVLVAPGKFEIRNVPIPEFGDNEVLIRVSRCGICGTDLHMFNGHYAAENLPLVPGHEFTGTISDIGSDVLRFSVGTKVVADINIGCGHCFWCRRGEILNCPDVKQVGISRDGAFAQYVAMPARLVIPCTLKVADEILALVEPVSCVVRAARKSGISFGQSVAILGCGPIGNLHVQMMRLLGAAPIIASDISPQRTAMAKEVGADAVVSDPAKLSEVVSAMTEGRGVDVVIESVGLGSLYQQAFDLIRKGGHVAAFGIVTPGEFVPLDILKTILEENSVKGSVAGMGEDMHDALTLLSHRRFNTRHFTQAQYELEDIQSAFESIPERINDLKTQIRL